MIKRDYLFKIIDLLEDEFNRILMYGFDADSKFYDYIEDLRTVIDSIKE